MGQTAIKHSMTTTASPSGDKLTLVARGVSLDGLAAFWISGTHVALGTRVFGTRVKPGTDVCGSVYVFLVRTVRSCLHTLN